MVEGLGLGLGACWLVFLVGPIEIWIVIRDPFFDGLPRGLNRLHCFDIEWGWRWSREGDDTFPETLEAYITMSGMNGTDLRVISGNFSS